MSSLKFRKMLLDFLPGNKFTLFVGLVIGVTFTANQSTPTKRFKMLHTAYAVLLNMCIFIGSIDWIYNVLPSLSDDKISYSISDIVGQGIAVFFALLSVVYRTYLLILASPLSSFMKRLDDSGSFLAPELSSFKIWVNTLVSVYFFSMAWEAIYVAGVVVELNKDSPWLSIVGNFILECIVAFVAWNTSIVRFVTFAIVITALDRLLDVLEGFVKRAESIVGVASARRFGKRGMNGESYDQLRMEANNLEIQHLLSELQNIQELFDRYDHLLGPLIFLLLSNSTIGFVDAITEVVHSKVEELEIRSDVTQLVTLFNHLLPFSLLNMGFVTKNRIKYLRISLKRDIAAAMSLSRNERLVNLYRNVEEFSWEMSAAGFFNVDRSLMTGIASVALSYVVLLLQIQGVLKPGNGSDDQLREQLLRLLAGLTGTQLATEMNCSIGF